MQNIDLHSLRVLNEIYQTGSLSRTAVRLELSQPAISLTLAKLRKHFGDPLFVRVGNQMRPTPHTQGLMESVVSSITAIESTLNYHVKFDPAQSVRTFRIALTDVGLIAVLPALLREIAKVAPNVRIDVSSISDRTAQNLEAGDLDLAVGFVPRIPRGFLQQSLYLERFICLVRATHPRVKGHLTNERYKNESHIVVVSSVTSHLIVDRVLDEQNIRRLVAARVSNFLSLPALIGSTDHICTLPRRAGLIMAASPDILALPVPFKLPTYAVKQFWHERQTRDPGNRWLRGLVMQLAGGRMRDA